MWYVVLLTPIAIITILVIIAQLVGARLLKKKRQNKLEKALQEIRQASPYSNPHKKDEYLAKDKQKDDLTKQKSEVEIYNAKQDKVINKSYQETKIVGIEEPKGFWSRFIMSQKLENLLLRLYLQKKNPEGFWVNLVNSQALNKGKGKGKGR